MIEEDHALLDSLRPEDGRGRAERAILFDLSAWDVNCPQHILQMVDAAELAFAVAQREEHIAALEAEIKRLGKADG